MADNDEQSPTERDHHEVIGGPGAQPGEVDEREWHSTYRRTLNILNRQWVARVALAIEERPLRPFALLLVLQPVQPKVLRETLRAMAAERLVRQVIVDDGKGWELTEDGRSMLAMLGVLFRWGRDHLDFAAEAGPVTEIPEIPDEDFEDPL